MNVSLVGQSVTSVQLDTNDQLELLVGCRAEYDWEGMDGVAQQEPMHPMCEAGGHADNRLGYGRRMMMTAGDSQHWP